MSSRVEPQIRTERRSDRRSFLSQTLKTVGAGLGLAMVAAPPTAAAAGAPRTRRGARPQNATACAIFCSPVDCSCSACSCTGQWLYHCVSQCGDQWNECFWRSSCSGFCYSPNAC